MITQKIALITGSTGQDGSFVAEFLSEKGDIVHGITRRASSFNTQRVDHIYQDLHMESTRFKLHYGDRSDSSNLTRVLQEAQIPRGALHRMVNPGLIPLEIIEVQSGSYLGEGDILPFEDSYGRSS